MQNNDPDNRISDTDASAGSKNGTVRWILLISLSLAIVAMTVIWVTGAATQDDVESQGTTTGRVEAEAESGAQNAPDAN